MSERPQAQTQERLLTIYETLLCTYGPRNWWPAESPCEVIIGAILTQNTNWKNVEKAIASLRQEGLIDWQRLSVVSNESLAAIIRPAGYHNLKARRLKNFVAWLWCNYEGSLDRLKQVPQDRLREELLTINGIGPETADSILLYALHFPSFVVDTYTGRVARRHGLIDSGHDYEQLRGLFERHIPPDVPMYNEFHALIVEVGKRHCSPKARCAECPLNGFAHDESK